MLATFDYPEHHILQLPAEIFYYLFSHLSDIHDLLHLREVCTYFGEISLFALKELNLRKYAQKITDPILSNILSYCRAIQTLCISNCHVTDQVFTDIVRFCPRLTRLHAYNIVMTPDCFDTASQVMTNLRELTLGRGASCSAVDETQEKDISMRLLEFSTNLTTLNLCYRTAPSLRCMRDGLQYLKHCSKIEKITIFTQLKICSHDTTYFSALPNLTTLLFASTQLTTGALAALGQCEKLSELYLHDVVLNENGMSALSRIPHLKRLFLVRIRGLTDLGVARLAYCPALEGLEIIKSDTLTDEGIAPIAKCKSLKIVCLEQTPNVTLNIKKSFQLCAIVVVLQN
eukprot:Phypoly_transcript_09948.p1 GENE.Phypoly_transcript_09948~~Phypoly_transcript_09948.p1  ORF type:complete len:344 (+),score=29.91 Phypoly_transcript_09948:288-1319(+)